MKKTIQLLTLAALATFSGSFAAHADTHTWTGAAITYNWSTPANWAANNPPYAGELAPVYIIFPAGAARLANFCNIANLVVDEIVFSGSGYNILSAAPGTAITLSNPFITISCSAANNTIAVPLVLGAPNMSFLVAAGTDLHLTGALSGPGGFKKFGKGDLYLEGTADNTFTGTTTVVGGTLHLKKSVGQVAFGGPLVIGDTNGPAYAGQPFDSYVQLDADQQMGFSTPVSVNPDGELKLYGHNLALGSLTMIGNSQITDGYTGDGTLTLLGNVSTPYFGNFGYRPYIDCKVSLGGATRTFDVVGGLDVRSPISSGGGNAGITKIGYGDLSLQFANTYTGVTMVSAGGVHIRGSQPSSPVVVQSSAYVSGDGSAGAINCQGGAVYPYYGTMTSKDVTMDSASTFGVTIQDYQTPLAPAFLTVTGAVNLGGCKLTAILNTNATFDPFVGTQFILIRNDGNDPITGTFAGLPDGAKLKFGGRLWHINYQGGTGNDVVLTLLSTQLPLSTDSLVNNTVDHWTYVYGTGTPGVKYELHYSTNFTTWTKVRDANNNNGTLEALDSRWYQGAPKCFYRFYQP